MALLLVDDDEICIFLNKKIIRYAGIEEEIQSAGNGVHAIEIIKSNFENGLPLPSMIMLDLDMPIMDGFAFIASFNELKLPGSENVKIIIVSSSVTQRDIDRAASLGIMEFIQKPLDVPSLRKLFKDIAA